MGSASDAGRVRLRNEDRIACDPGLGLAVLADGMGGHAGGAEAALLAVAEWLAVMRAACGVGMPDEAGLRLAVQQANERVHRAGNDDPALRGMGTTLVGACFRNDDVLILGHVGDSRLYRLRAGGMQCLTRDHCMLQGSGGAGMMGSPLQRGLLTRAVGVEAFVEPDVAAIALEPDDIFLLCSDGLTDMVCEGDIAEVLATLGGNPHVAANHLIDLANDRGGMDNVSVIVVSGPAALSSGTVLG